MNLGVKSFIVFVAIILFLTSCKNTSKDIALFELLEEDQTGINFSNDLTTTLERNIFNYLYFYNGGGVGAGDFNNDGLIDLFFTGNQVPNELYLNSGKMKFENVTSKSNIKYDSTWSTGVSIVDINNDGMLDIYVSSISQIMGLEGKNKFYICKKIDDFGIPHYEDQAKVMGLDSTGYGTQAVFFDFDMDGDLDMFQLNHSTHKNNTFGQRKSFEKDVNGLAGDKMFRNDDGKFVDVSASVGINRSSIGYGLGVVVSDINMDGFPDIYIGNDFHENDYYYVNNGNGTFSDKMTEQMMHTSRFSMGVDAADINNDGYPEIISLDMQPEDPYILKKSEGEDALDIYNFKLGYGYHNQYAQNALQLNNRNNTFTEIAPYSGIHATDWSWSSLFADFDNDGFKDLFITNGIPKRMNDIDYINFITQSEVQWKISMDRMEEKDLELIHRIPEIKIFNKIYKNNGNLKFDDLTNSVTNNRISYSNGAIIADLDNDGDLDIVCNNINDKAFVYENKICKNENCENSSVTIHLKGNKSNINAVGAKVIVFAKETIKTYEKFPVKGFLSSMEVPLVIAKNEHSVADSIVIIWPDNSYEKLDINSMKVLNIDYKNNLPKFNYASIKNKKISSHYLKDVTRNTKLKFLHKENPFVEFNREPLIPRAVSNEGPAIAVADINGDGLDDVFFGNAKWKESEIWVQLKDGSFVKTTQPNISIDSVYEDVDAAFADFNNDGHLDLVVASGGNEYTGQSEYLNSRIYLNNGKGVFNKKNDALSEYFTTASCVLPCDFNNDGFTDLFIGGRAVPWKYGEIPKSFLLQNDGKGNFSDISQTHLPDKGLLGLVTGGQWEDMDKDGLSDLVLSLEWGQITALYNRKNEFEKVTLSKEKGWWNFVKIVDIDNDGDKDIIAGNFGINSKLKASESEPVRMYYEDFDNNDTKEQVVTYYLKGKEIPFANIFELHKQIPSLKKKFLKAEDFSKASLQELFPSINQVTKFEANYFENAIFINDEKSNFSPVALPYRAQFSSFKTVAVFDANGDDLPDLIFGGNFYENNVQLGRQDGDFGGILINKGNGDFDFTPHDGDKIKGQIRKIVPLRKGMETLFIIGRNNEPITVIVCEAG